MAGKWAETTLGRLLSFANGRSSPERADGLPYLLADLTKRGKMDRTSITLLAAELWAPASS